MFDRMSVRAKKVMSFARQEAEKLNHEYVGTEHLLLGLVQEGSGVAANVLKNMNLDLERVRHEIEKIVKTGPSVSGPREAPLTPRAKKALELAREEAARLSHNYIGTEHLLMGLIVEQEGIAAQVLINLGIRLEDVREEVLEFLGALDSIDEEDGKLPPLDAWKPLFPDLPEERIEETRARLERSRAQRDATLDRLCARYLPRLRRIVRVRLGRLGPKLVDRMESLGVFQNVVREAFCNTGIEFNNQAELLESLANLVEARIRPETGNQPDRATEDFVDEVVAQLPERDREIIVSFFYLGCTEQEVAERLGIAMGEVQPRLLQTLMRIAPTLGPIIGRGWDGKAG